MKVCHYAHSVDRIEGGHKFSIQNQRKALDKANIDYTTDPQDDYDILHVNLWLPPSIYRMKQARRNGKKIVAHGHSIEEDFKDSFRFSNYLAPLFRRYLKYYYRHADLIICVSEYTERVLNDWGFDNTTVISNGIDTERFNGFKDRRQQARDRHGLDGTAYFCVGSVFKRKGIETFIELARRNPNREFIWFGAIFNSAIMQRGTNSLVKDAPDNVIFTGFIDDIRDAYAAGDIFLYPTQEETHGMPAYEAAYCGKPIILRDIPAFRDAFEDGHDCRKASNIEEFEEAMEEIEEDDKLREQLETNAQETAGHHTLDNVGEELKDAYERVLG
ncbi:MAG: glycosyltransferase family 4 protein [Candidatus Nanohaloarchaea archaeon]|nr:glycosyltransferase family 4 protein [Candidatus Nanohaloarchaea archaeon]